MDKIKELLGLGPEVTDDAVATRMLAVLGDLAAALKLPPEASLSQITSALAALQAGEASLREKTAELTALKARLAAEAADKAVGAALQAGKITPAQTGWALEYFRQDPQGFATYVAHAPKTVPLGDLLSLQGEERSPASALAPEELDICRSLEPGAGKVFGGQGSDWRQVGRFENRPYSTCRGNGNGAQCAPYISKVGGRMTCQH